ncbi:MAG: hypothetical protein OXF79_14575 [Chloroflexi bacterium]|nr:hypothetical protein [Chloroflexota bacterium]
MFVVEALWEEGRGSQDPISVDEPAFTVGALILGIAVASSLVLSIIFRFLYQRDDAALTNVEQGTQEATP